MKITFWPGIFFGLSTISGFTAVRDFGMNASLNTKIYGTFLFSKGPVKAIRHMITPRATFNFRPDFGTEQWNYYQNFTDTLGNNLFYNRYNGFLYGSPGRGSNGAITIAIDNNLEAKVMDRSDTTGGTKKVKLLEKVTNKKIYLISSVINIWMFK